MSEGIDEIADLAKELFDIKSLAVSITKLYSLTGRRKTYRRIVESFKSNLSGVDEVVSIPMVMAVAAVANNRLHRKLMYEEFREIINKLRGGSHNKIDMAKLSAEVSDEMTGTKKRTDASRTECQKWLSHILEMNDVFNAVHELKRQSALLIWNALEIFVRDLATEYMNENPAVCLQLSADDTIKKRFNIKNISLEQLAERGFNVKSSMGELIVQQCDLSDISAMKGLFAALFPQNKNVSLILSSPKIWELSQRRHLIVHRRGVVDKKYIQKTGDKLELGIKINIEVKELGEYIKETTGAAEILMAACLSYPPQTTSAGTR